MNRNAKLLIAGNFITDIGNGMFNLALGLLLYLETKSVLAFAVVLSSEYVIGLFMHLFAGPVVDRGDPKKTMIIIDLLRGGSLILSAVVYYFGMSLWPLYLTLIILNVVKPFYKSANFSLTPEVVPQESIVRVVSLKGAASEAGQLLGVALAGPLLQYINSMSALVIDGLSFIGSAVMTAMIVVDILERKVNEKKSLFNFFADWTEIAKILWKKPSAVWILFLASGDFLFVGLINLFLVPLNKEIANNAFHLALMDGGFAVGALLMGLITDQITARLGKRLAVLTALLIQGISFYIMAVSRDILIITGIMLLLGLGNTLSIAIFMSSLQIRAKGNIKGRISAFRQIIVSVICSTALPLLAQLVHVSKVETAALISGCIVGVYFLFTLMVTNSSVYGDRLFSDRIEPELVSDVAPHLLVELNEKTIA